MTDTHTSGVILTGGVRVCSGVCVRWVSMHSTVRLDVTDVCNCICKPAKGRTPAARHKNKAGQGRAGRGGAGQGDAGQGGAGQGRRAVPTAGHAGAEGQAQNLTQAPLQQLGTLSMLLSEEVQEAAHEGGMHVCLALLLPHLPLLLHFLCNV